jgi:putative inorganic carbon (HCO3(-)) transporter
MLLLVLLLSFAILSFLRPTFAVGLILALLPTYQIRYEFYGVPTTFLELLVIVFLLVTFVWKFNRLGTLKDLGSTNWLIGLFVLAASISVVVSPDKHASIGVFKAFILEPVLFFYALRLTVASLDDLTTPLNLLFVSAVVISIFGIFQHLTFIYLPLRFWGTGAEIERITSVFTYPNALALYLAPLISFFLAAFMFDEVILNRKNLALGLLIMASALFFTYSRGAWLGVLATSAMLLFYKYPVKKVAGAMCLIVVVLLALPPARNRLLLTARDASSAAHADLMAAAVRKLQTNPVFGNGLAGFRQTLAEQNFTGEILNYPHNILLNFWVEMGILGLVSMAGIVFVSIRKQKLDKNWYTLGATAFLVTMIIHGIVDVPYFKNDLSILFWFMISIFYI